MVILPRVALSDGGRMIDVCICWSSSLNCRVGGHFENFSSASGRDVPGLTGISPWKALSEGGEWLGGSPSWRREVSG